MVQRTGGSDRLGTAAFMDPAIVGEIYEYETGDWFLGVEPGFGKVLGHRSQTHALLVGGTRGGKGACILIPQLCLNPASFLVVDCKGELASVTAARRGKGRVGECQGMQQKVLVLDPDRVCHVEPEYLATFNPIDWVREGEGGEKIKRAGRLAVAMMPIAKGENASESSYFKNDARIFLAAVILHVATCEDFLMPRSLATVYKLVNSGNEEDRQELINAGIISEDRNAMEVFFGDMISNPVFNYRLKSSGTRFSTMCRDAAKQWLGVQGEAAQAMEWVNNPDMERVLSSSSFSFREMKTDPKGVTVYLSLKQTSIQTDDWAWLRMLIDIFDWEMRAVEEPPANGLPVVAMLDEFAGLRRMETIETGLAQIAGSDVRMLFAVQNMAQLEREYGAGMDDFKAGCKTVIAFANSDDMTLDWIEKKCGTMEASYLTENHTGTQTMSLTLGQSKANAHTHSLTDGETIGQSLSDSQNRNSSHTLTDGNSAGKTTSYQSGLLDFVPRALKLRTQESYGSTPSHSKSRTTGDGVSYGITSSQHSNQSITNSDTLTQSQSLAIAMSEADAKGVTQHKQGRPLFMRHDVEKYLAAIEDERHPMWPGMALLYVSGNDPALIQKVPYWSHPIFWKTYSAHPKHGFKDTPKPEWLLSQEADKRLREQQQKWNSWSIAERQRRRKRMLLDASEFASQFYVCLRLPSTVLTTLYGNATSTFKSKVLNAKSVNQVKKGEAIVKLKHPGLHAEDEISLRAPMDGRVERNPNILEWRFYPDAEKFGELVLSAIDNQQLDASETVEQLSEQWDEVIWGEVRNAVSSVDLDHRIKKVTPEDFKGQSRQKWMCLVMAISAPVGMLALLSFGSSAFDASALAGLGMLPFLLLGGAFLYMVTLFGVSGFKQGWDGIERLHDEDEEFDRYLDSRNEAKGSFNPETVRDLVTVPAVAPPPSLKADYLQLPQFDPNEPALPPSHASLEAVRT